MPLSKVFAKETLRLHKGIYEPAKSAIKHLQFKQIHKDTRPLMNLKDDSKPSIPLRIGNIKNMKM